MNMNSSTLIEWPNEYLNKNHKNELQLEDLFQFCFWSGGQFSEFCATARDISFTFYHNHFVFLFSIYSDFFLIKTKYTLKTWKHHTIKLLFFIKLFPKIKAGQSSCWKQTFCILFFFFLCNWNGIQHRRVGIQRFCHRRVS